MLLRAVLFLALAAPGVAFQAPGRLAAGFRSHAAELKATNNYGFTPMNEERQDRYGRSGRSLDSGGPLPRFGSNTAEPRPTRRAQQLLNNQRPPAQYFGGTFAAQAPAQAPAAVPTSEELRIQIDVEKSKDTKDYNRLGQLTSQLQAREALDVKANELQTEILAAEARADYDRCQELQAQLQGLETSMSGGTAYATDQGQGASSGVASYNNNNYVYNRRPEVTTSDMAYYGGVGYSPYTYGPYAGGYGMSSWRADVAMRTHGAYARERMYGGLGYPYYGGGYSYPFGYGYNRWY